MSVLNITNGDGAANILKASTVEGDVLPWRDPMHHGPFPDVADLDEVSLIRARYLAGPGFDRADVERDFQLRDEHLRAATKYDRVVLWFEHDLLDQLQILQLLDWFAHADLSATRLEMICIDHFDGIDTFRGIGELNTDQMATLLVQRHTVTKAQLDLAVAGWSAFRSLNPLDLVKFMDLDLGALPFLRATLERHLQEYPSRHSGLTRSEQQILRLVADGAQAPGEIFVQNMELETAMFIGDWPTFSIIENLCACTHPLLYCDPDGTFRYRLHFEISRESFRAQRLSLTRLGEQVLAGQRDAFACIERDQWLGGVHLQSCKPMWTWDDSTGGLQLREL